MPHIIRDTEEWEEKERIKNYFNVRPGLNTWLNIFRIRELPDSYRPKYCTYNEYPSTTLYYKWIWFIMRIIGFIIFAFIALLFINYFIKKLDSKDNKIFVSVASTLLVLWLLYVFRYYLQLWYQHRDVFIRNKFHFWRTNSESYSNAHKELRRDC